MSTKDDGASLDNFNFRKARIPDELRLHEDDPDLEREYRALAQWLVDLYLWRQQERYRRNPQGRVDNQGVNPTLNDEGDDALQTHQT